MSARGLAHSAPDDTKWPPLGHFPSLPYFMLSGLLLIASASAALISLAPAVDSERHVVAVGAALFFLVMSVWVRFFASRFRRGWGLDSAVVVTSMVPIVAAAYAQAPEVQVILGLSIVLFGVYAAYFRPARRFVVELIVMIVAYGVVVLIVQPLMFPPYFVVVALISTAVSGTVAVLVAQLRAQALSDGLTGVLNRRGLHVMGDFVRADMRRSGAPASVALIDLDDFKGYNDRHGHLAGDQLLVSVAAAIKGGLRATDVVARFGGDEFALIMPGAEPAQAREVLDRVARTGGTTTWSSGVARWSHPKTLSEALSEADHDLYQAKHSR